ncbi:MAG: alpha-E domain-containing protein [Chloroflexota bacterium]
MLCRVAEDIFWMARYVERAIWVCRLIDVTAQVELDAGEADTHAQLWTHLLGPDSGVDARELSPRAVRHRLSFDRSNPGSLVECIRRGREAARGVRESISSEMWEQLNSLYLSLTRPDLAASVEDNPSAFYRQVRERAQFFEGLADLTMARDEAWHFNRVGKKLERADNVARVIRMHSYLLRPSPDAAPMDETVRWLAVLRSCGCAEAYAHHYALRVEPARALEFLLLNPLFPQSMRFSLNAAWESLSAIAGIGPSGAPVSNQAVRTLAMARAVVETTEVDQILSRGLEEYLSDIQSRIATAADDITATYLRYEPQSGRVVAATRAAMIMAQQQ